MKTHFKAIREPYSKHQQVGKIFSQTRMPRSNATFGLVLLIRSLYKVRNGLYISIKRVTTNEQGNHVVWINHIPIRNDFWHVNQAVEW